MWFSRAADADRPAGCRESGRRAVDTTRQQASVPTGIRACRESQTWAWDFLGASRDTSRFSAHPRVGADLSRRATAVVPASIWTRPRAMEATASLSGTARATRAVVIISLPTWEFFHMITRPTLQTLLPRRLRRDTGVAVEVACSRRRERGQHRRPYCASTWRQGNVVCFFLVTRFLAPEFGKCMARAAILAWRRADHLHLWVRWRH